MPTSQTIFATKSLRNHLLRRHLINGGDKNPVNGPPPQDIGVKHNYSTPFLEDKIDLHNTIKNASLLRPKAAPSTPREWTSLAINTYGYCALGLMTLYHSSSVLKMYCGSRGLSLTGRTLAFQQYHLAGYFGAWVGGEISRFTTNYFTQKWRDEAYRHYIERVIQWNRGRTDCWAVDKTRKEVGVWVGPQAENVIKEAFYVMGWIAASALGICGDMLALSTIATPYIIPACLLSGAIAALYYCQTNDRRRLQARSEQETRAKLTLVTDALPDNVMLPNTYNFKLWRHQFSQARDAYFTATAHEQKELILDDICFTLGAAAVPFAVMIWLASTSVENGITALAAAPAIISLLTQYCSLMLALGRWPSVGGQMAALLSKSHPTGQHEFENRCKILGERAQYLQLTHNGILMPITAILREPGLIKTPGRWQIQAPNGTGKSVLLQILAAHFGPSNVTYFPPISQLTFNKTKGGSSGELACSKIIELGEHDSAPVLILDEWDGLLDPENTTRVSNQIDTWSLTRSVVEVRQDWYTDCHHGHALYSSQRHT